MDESIMMKDVDFYQASFFDGVIAVHEGSILFAIGEFKDS